MKKSSLSDLSLSIQRRKPRLHSQRVRLPGSTVPQEYQNSSLFALTPLFILRLPPPRSCLTTVPASTRAS